MSTEQPSRRRPTHAHHAELSRKVGRFLSDRFRASGLSRKEAADRAGISEGYLTGILAGRVVSPGPHIIRAMAEGWGFNLIDYFRVTGEITDQDVEDYVAQRQVVTESTPDDIASIVARLSAMPPRQRRSVVKTLSTMLNTITDVSRSED